MYEISIVTPVSQQDEKYIKRCYETVKGQLQANVEWIVILEGDSPLAEQVQLENKENPNVDIKVVVDTELKNVNEKRNKGIEVATGEYLYFLDVDDFLHEHTLYVLLESAKSNSASYDVILGAIKETNVSVHLPSSYSRMLKRLLDNRIAKPKTLAVKKYRASALNTLFKREFIVEHGIYFDENVLGFSDILFTSQAYTKTTKAVVYDKDAIYLKLIRNDPINDPSIAQALNGIEWYPQSMAQAIASLEDGHPFKNVLLKRFLKAYHYKYLNGIYNEDPDDVYKGIWSDAFKQIGLDQFSFSRSIHQKEIQLLCEGHYKKAARMANRRLNFRMLKKIKKKPGSYRRVLYQKWFTKKMAIKKDYILYESFLGRNYSDSPKYIYEYLNRTYPGKYKHIWVFNDPDREEPKGVVKVKRFGLKHLYFMARAKFHVNNMRQPKWFVKRPGQVFLATWHGTPLKKLVFDMNEVHSANPNYKKDFYLQSRAWDYLVSANHYSTEIFKRAFMFDNEILEHGYPRNDLLYAENKEQIADQLKAKLQLPKDKKIVLYAPTWRDDEFYKPGQYKFKLQLDLEKLKATLGDEYFFLIRTHYFIADKLDFSGVEDFVYNASQYDDVTELYLLADVLITDYSSVFFDYANLKRPILFFTYDLEKYRDTLRGFYIDLETDVPGPLLKTTDEIIAALANLNETKELYKERIEKFYDQYCHLDDGRASEKIAEKVIVSAK